MKGLDGLLKNPLIKRAFEKQLQKIFAEHGLKMVTISIDTDGEFKIEAFKEEMSVITTIEIQEMTKKLLSL